MTDPFQEIAELKARLAGLEAEARAVVRVDLAEAVADAWRPRPPVSRERKALESEAHGFVPDAQSEAAIAAKARNPAAYDAAQRAMGASSLEQSLYERGRSAAIDVGAWIPPTEETK